MAGRLQGKVAIVTGAGGGIGREHARLFAEEGAHVVVNDLGTRPGADAASVVAEITANGGIAVADTGSATWDGAAGIVATALDTFGRVDIVVNNATAGHNNDLWRFTEEEWDLTVGVNLKGYFAMIREVAPHFARQRSGAIVSTSSGSGFGHPSHVAYAAAKEGVVGLTRTVARELGRFGVRCNAIRPLAVSESTHDYERRTERWASLMALTMAPRGARPSPSPTSVTAPAPAPREVTLAPAKISPIVVWLCTDAARGVNGRTFHVGGNTISRLSEPARERVITAAEGWTLDLLDAVAPTHLVDDLTNEYALDDHPELQEFEA